VFRVKKIREHLPNKKGKTMSIPTPDQLGLYYPSKELTTADSPLPDRTVSTGSTTMNIVTSSLNETSDYWNGAVGFFCGNSTNVLRGLTFHVRKWDATNKSLQITTPLPVAPAAGDTFRIFVGGKIASSQDVLAMKVSGKQPEVETVQSTAITGITIRKVSALLGEGTLTMYYTYSSTLRTLKIKMGSDVFGPEVAITSDTTTVALYDKNQAGFVVVDVAYPLLRTASYQDTFTLTTPKGNLIPNFEGYETNDGFGRTRYHLVVAKNKMPTPQDVMNALGIWTSKPIGTPSVLSSSYSYSLNYTAPLLVYAPSASNFADWPTRGFWIRNKNKNDLRYVDYRSGNILYTKIVDWGNLTFKNGTTELTSGMTIANAATSPTITAIIDQVTLDNGSYSSGNASGSLVLKKYTGNGVFGTTSNIYVNGQTAAIGNGVSTRGYRGKVAQNWSTTDTIEPISDIDIGIDIPSGNFFKDPSNENTAPNGITFGLYPAQDECLTHDYLTGGSSIGIWLRQTILDGTQARENIVGDLNFCWF
jgi:hypothetical protein